MGEPTGKRSSSESDSVPGKASKAKRASVDTAIIAEHLGTIAPLLTQLGGHPKRARKTKKVDTSTLRDLEGMLKKKNDALHNELRKAKGWQDINKFDQVEKCSARADALMAEIEKLEEEVEAETKKLAAAKAQKGSARGGVCGERAQVDEERGPVPARRDMSTAQDSSGSSHELSGYEDNTVL